jgi:hypothetical protein
VINGTTPVRAVQPTVITSTTPNSHRISITTPARAVTPNKPHAMIRHSTHQQNLTNDMLVETIQQANHVFSLPTGSTIRSPPREATDTPITIMSEMTNAVICPESGKSLKHQELVTMLRYTIKCPVNRKRNSQALQNQYYQIYSQIKHATRTQINIWFICIRHQRT